MSMHSKHYFNVLYVADFELWYWKDYFLNDILIYWPAPETYVL